MERWRQIEFLFQEALLRSEEERDAWLGGTCATDADLHREVASLLANYREQESSQRWAAAAASRLIGEAAFLKPGERLGPYQISSFIAAGGMGTVYRAYDPRMRREVAIKVCAEGFNESFAREVQTAAALNHPNICHLYDVGPNYLVMELVEGETLADRISRGAIPLPEALGIARQIAGGLEAAHEKGIVHCDLKPGNIKLKPDGTVKVLDFGLAKRLDTAATTGSSFGGTAAYMAPEQALAKGVDLRADIFSFGVVFYEMLGGYPAFAGEDSAASVAAVVHKEPAPLPLPADLGNLLSRCLQKTPQGRFQSIQEVKAALAPPSIAVLPFANMSGDAQDEYFSDGLSEEIINALSGIPGLKVTARMSSFAFRGKSQDVRTIAEILGVRWILQGSVRRLGNRLRIAAQLISAADGTHFWSQRYDLEILDIFAVQDEIATAIAGALQLRLTGNQSELRRPRNIPAYEEYLKGRHCLFRATPQYMAQAREYFEKASVLDPEYAEPHQELATYYLFLCLAGLGSAREMGAQICDRARKALELNPSAGLPHALLGYVAAMQDYDWAEARRRFALALSASRVQPEVRLWYAGSVLTSLRYSLGMIEEQIDRALEADPLNSFLHINFAGMCFVAGMRERALLEVLKAMDINENFWMCHLGMGSLDLIRGRLAEAVSAFERAHEFAPWNPQVIGHLAGALTRIGDHDRAETIIRRMKDVPPYSVPSGMVVYHCLASRSEAAADCLEEAIGRRDPMALIYFRNPLTVALQRSNRWTRLGELMNLPGAVISRDDAANW